MKKMGHSSGKEKDKKQKIIKKTYPFNFFHNFVRVFKPKNRNNIILYNL
jgi:hypothetical protein